MPLYPFEERHTDLVSRFVARFPIPHTGADDARAWTRKLAEQFRYTFPDEGWGTKSSSPTSPPSSDALARLAGGTLTGYDMLSDAGGVDSRLNGRPDPIDLSGQTYIAVSPIDAIGGTPPVSGGARIFPWEPRHEDALRRFADRYPPPTTGPIAAAAWAAKLASQFAFTFPGEGWGHAAPAGDLPASVDTIARRVEWIFSGYDVVREAGGPGASVVRQPIAFDLSGGAWQWVPVVNIDALGGAAPPVLPPAPPIVLPVTRPPLLDAVALSAFLSRVGVALRALEPSMPAVDVLQGCIEAADHFRRKRDDGSQRDPTTAEVMLYAKMRRAGISLADRDAMADQDVRPH